MNSIDVAISVPASDRHELEDLCLKLEMNEEPFETRALDGDTLCTVVLSIYTATLPIVAVWLRARVTEKKNSSVSYKGVSIHGYTAGDATQILNILERGLEPRKPDA
jgi:hypothetical protein